MNRDELITVALSAGGQNVEFTPVQVQKLFFLLDREASALVDGPHFDFQPYDYGPFDRNVYDLLNSLAAQDIVETRNEGKYRTYLLTPKGYQQGQNLLADLPVNSRNYIAQLSNWIRALTFGQLVAAIYKRYPDMKVNSVFNQ